MKPKTVPLEQSPELRAALGRAQLAAMRASYQRLVAVCNGDERHARRVWRQAWRATVNR